MAAVTASMSLCTSNLIIHGSRKKNLVLYSSRLRSDILKLKTSHLFVFSKTIKTHHDHAAKKLQRKFTVLALTEGSSSKSSKSEETLPSWAKLDSDQPPPWAQNKGKDTSQQTFEIPFYVYLLASTITAIAAIGSVFEYINQKPVFGLLNSDSIFYAPVLGFFVFTGVPTSAFLWFKSVQAANKEAEEQDKRDGYR